MIYNDLDNPTVTTTGLTPATIYTRTYLAGTVLNADILITGIDQANNKVVRFSKTLDVGGNGMLTGLINFLDTVIAYREDALAYATCAVNVTATANTVSINVTGAVGRTIKWIGRVRSFIIDSSV